MKKIELFQKSTGNRLVLYIPTSDILSQLYRYEINKKYSCDRIDLFVCEDIDKIPEYFESDDWTCNEEDQKIILDRIKEVCDFLKICYSDYLFLSNNVDTLEKFISDISDIITVSKDEFIRGMFTENTDLYNYIRYTFNVPCISNDNRFVKICQQISDDIDKVCETGYIDLSEINPPSLLMPATDILNKIISSKIVTRYNYSERHKDDFFSKRYTSFENAYRKNIIWFDMHFAKELLKENIFDICGTYQPVSIKLISLISDDKKTI